MSDEGIVFNLEENEGTFRFVYTGSEKARYLSLNNQTGNDYFAMYEGTISDLYLIPATEGEEAVPELTGITVNATKTTFTVGDEFAFEGTVTANYSNGTTKDVTESATFTGYNMSQEGSQPITVTYEGKTATYYITVNPAQGGGAKTISFKLDNTVTGSTSTTYVQTETAFTHDGIQYAVNNWNPSTLQIRGNQTSQTNMQSGKNFYLRNKTAIPGKITSIKVEYTSGSLVATSIYAVTSTSQITNQTTSASKKGTAATNAVIWDFDANSGYFAIGMQKGGTSGTAISGTITITYEEN
jgi:hypothetical protein